MLKNGKQNSDITEKTCRTNRAMRVGAIGIIILMLALVLSAGAASAADTGWVSPTNNMGGSGVSNPTNAYADDSNYASFTGNPSDWEWYGYDFSSIPAGSTINGIEVNAKGKYATSYGSSPMAVQLSWDDGSTWTSSKAATFGTTNSDHFLGGSADVWGHTPWTRDEIVTNFRVNPSWSTWTDAWLYYLPVRVYYTLGAPTYNVTVTPSPTSAGVVAGGNYVYTITVNNTGITDGNYTINATDSDLTNFSASAIGTSPLAVAAGGSAQTTLTVTATGGAPISASDITNVTVTSVEDAANYTDSALVTTTVEAPAPSVSVTLTPSAQGVQPDNQVSYTVTVDNTGNVADSYTLSLDNADTADFTYGLVSTSTGSVDAGGQYVTTMTVDATADATVGNNHGQTVAATGTASNTSNTATTTVQAAGPTQIIVKTNRNIVLDDPNYDFSNNNDEWGSNYWNGETTTIRAYALAIDDRGNAIANYSIIFSITGVAGSTSSGITTDANGIASYSYQLNDASNNGDKTPGSYTITANASTVVGSTTFTYSYFGCSNCHNSKGKKSNSNPKSPYITTSNTFHTSTNNHHSGDGSSQINNNQCNYCHSNYGTGDRNTANPKTAGVHSTTQDCVDCHDAGGLPIDLSNVAADIKDCDFCHPRYNNKVTNFASASFWSGGMIQFSSLPMVAHQATPAIPCVICHGPMHNTTVPDVVDSNTYTEDAECTTCHASKGKHSGNNPVYCTACHSQDAHVIGVMDKISGTQPAFVDVGSANAMTVSDCTECHQSGPEATYFAGLTGLAGGYGYTTDYAPASPSHKNHNGTVECTRCHGGDNSVSFHNIKFIQPSGAFSTSNGTAAECMDCHTNPSEGLSTAFPTAPQKQSHGTGTNCTICHSDNYHSIWLLSDTGTYIEDGVKNTTALPVNDRVTCMDCHQGAVITTATIGLELPKIAQTIQHSKNESNGSLWNQTPYWDGANETEKCIFCHANDTDVLVIHSSNALGRSAHIQSGNETVGTGVDGYWCANCHAQSTYDYNGTAFLKTPPTIDINNTGNTTSWVYPSLAWYDHSFLNTFNDGTCATCHTGPSDYDQELDTLSVFMHRIGVGAAGGPNCVSCHDVGGMSGVIHVDVSAINTSVHSGINSATSDTTGNTDNKICWACHSTTGDEPDTHPDKKSDPWKCPECHVGSQPAIANLTNITSAPKIYEHYKGANISVNHVPTVVDSCTVCHTVPSMLNSYSGSEGADNRTLASHYATKNNFSTFRDGDSENCAYCHQNPSDFEVAMAHSYSNNMTNHTDGINSPTCTNSTCHSVGRIHNSTLQKPVLSDALCNNGACHNSKPKHNDAVNCTTCHINSSSEDAADIHTIKYIQTNGSYSATNTSAANCTTCHQGSTVTTTSLNVTRLPKVALPMLHSNNVSNGSIWGTYWTNQSTACAYCHGDTKHASAALGNIAQFNGTNTINSTISASTNWCSSCHYEGYTSGSHSYSNMTATFVGMGVDVPPEITSNATYSNTSIPNYLDHSSVDKNDATCQKCHETGESSKISSFLHNVSEGTGGGPDCASCHSSSGGVAFDFDVFYISGHRNVNNDSTNATILTNESVKACWACHGDGTEQTVDDHKSYNLTTVKTCDDAACHGNTSLSINISSHAANVDPLLVSTSQACEYCHSRTNVAIYTQSVQGGTTNMSNTPSVGPVVTAHLIKNISDFSTDTHNVIDSVGWDGGSQGCVYCHKTPNGTAFGAINISESTVDHSNVGDDCYGCHIRGTTSLHDRTVVAGNGGPDCVACHDVGKPQADVNVTAMKTGMHLNLNNGSANVTILTDEFSKACWACHGNGTEPTGHFSEPLGGSVLANTTYPMSCNDGKCHVNNSYSAPLTQEHVPGAQQIGYYGINQINNCTQCHNNSLTNFIDPVWGNESGPDNSSANINSNVSHYGNTANLITPTTSCVSCHKSTANATIWGNATIVRHSINQTDAYCDNCHNTSTATTFHDVSIKEPTYVHNFDWENDDANEVLPSDSNEACEACHNDANNMTAGTISDANTNICEDCHKPDGFGYVGPFNTTINVRSDINDTIPRVYNHYLGADINVTNQSTLGGSYTLPSSCYSYDNSTLAGSCHGVSYYDPAPGGYFAHVQKIPPIVNKSMDPYYETMTIDYMPDTSDCRLCHLGVSPNGTLVNSPYMGNPMNVSSTKPNGADQHTNASADASNCWACHVSGGSEPVDFHASTITGGGGPDCISCHDIGSTIAQHRINASAVSTGIHANLNSNATNTTAPAANKKCWGCHQSDGTEPSGMGDKYDNPYQCYECHSDSAKPYNNVNNALNVTVHFKGNADFSAASMAADNSSSCIACHNKTEMQVSFTEDDTYNSTLSFASHYGKSRSDLRTGEAGSVDCSYCHQNASTVFNTAMLNSSLNSSIANHSLGYSATTPNCTNSTCHNTGWMHNSTLTKPTLELNTSQLCLNCHGDDGFGATNYTGAITPVQSKHNGSVNCTECHIEFTREIHGVKYLQQNNTYQNSNATANVVNCTTCHQSTDVDARLVLTPPKIPTNANNHLNHSDDPYAGGKWGTYWDNSSELGSCLYCHNETKHSISAIGNISAIAYGETMNASITSSSNWCAGCHYDLDSDYANTTAVYAAVPIEITGNTSYSNGSVDAADGTPYYNHTLDKYSDDKCILCHGSQLSNFATATTKEFVHNVAIGGFGPNCISCHDVGKLAPKVNVSSMNTSSSIHANLNSATPDTTGNADNKMCWGCHQTGGSQPADGDHPDRLITPYQCYDCHNGTAKPYNNVSNALNVTVHFQGNASFSAASMAANETDSCLACHNKTEMQVAFTEPDAVNTTLSIVSHYGMNRSDLRTGDAGSVDCSYCHQNTSTVFNTAMLNSSLNSSISNHSLGYSATTPNCTNSTCHNTGWMHNSTLTKPTLELNTSQLCLNCHGDDGFGATNYTGAITPVQSKHNDSVNCTECHIEFVQEIHGVKYLQQNSTYQNSNATATVVNCTTCHQSTTVDARLVLTPPKIPTNANNHLNHSDDPYAGGKWGAYWDNSSELGSCMYCHNETKHSISAIGNISAISYGETMNASITSSSNWCAGCHYDSDSDYANTTATYAPVPIEITGNASYSNGSVDAADGTPYFNHAITGYSDDKCRSCHGSRLSATPTTKEFVHNVAIGGYGPNCISCHDVGKDVAKVNVSSMNTSSSIHKNLNSDTPDTTGNTDNRMCWGCHQTGGLQPADGQHPDRVSSPYQCYDCHNATAKPYNNVSNALNVTVHFKGNANFSAASMAANNTDSCISCHNKTEMQVAFTEPDAVNTTLSLVSHYGMNRSDLHTGDAGSVDCSYCHQNTSTVFNTAMLNSTLNSSIANHSLGYSASTPNCTNSTCHNTGWMHNSTLTKPTLELNTSQLCLNCHGDDGFGVTNYTGAVTPVQSKHNGSVNCTECHIEFTREIHGVKYLQQNNTYNTSNASANVVNCTTCHQSTDVDARLVLTPPKTHTPLNHSNNASAGGIWGSYWTTQNGSCNYCHGDTKHNTTGLGKPDTFKGTNVKNSTLSTGTWCASCHYQNYGNYSDMVALMTPVPPEITSNATYAPFSQAGYYNHSLSNFNDSTCAACHDNEWATASAGFIHNVSIGLDGGPNCISCHDSQANIAALTVDVSAMSATTSMHSNLNNAVANGTNYACYACHGNGTTPIEHPPTYKTPKYCSVCHSDENAATNFSAPLEYRHIPSPPSNPGSASIVSTTASCETCHKNSVNTTGLEYRNNISRVSHYGTNTTLLKTTENCTDCHYYNESNRLAYGEPPQILMATAGGTLCKDCHSGYITTVWYDTPWGRYPEEELTVVDPENLHVSTIGTYWDCNRCH